MDFVTPIDALFPGAAASVVSVLAGAERPLSIRQIADRAGVSHPQVARHVSRLEALGVVSREVVGRSHLVGLTPTAAGALLRRFARLGDEVLHHLRTTSRRLEPNALSVAVFGSFARGQASAGSDIDIAVVARDSANDAWLEDLAQWVDDAAAYAGSPIAEMLVSFDDLRDRNEDPVWTAVATEGILLTGRPISELLERAGAPAPAP